MARVKLATLLSVIFFVSQASITREEVNSKITHDKDGVYFLNEATFDDFINYNDLVLVVFHEIGDMQPILHEYLVAIESRIADTQTLFQVAMVELNMSPMLEARYRPVTPPDFRIFQ